MVMDVAGTFEYAFVAPQGGQVDYCVSRDPSARRCNRVTVVWSVMRLFWRPPITSESPGSCTAASH